MHVQPVRLDQITIPPGHRPTKPEKVQAIADSIREIGLQHPIGVTGDFRLIHGRQYRHGGADCRGEGRDG
jgi:ParB-like chromosome segregation protein Spo0J